VPTRPQHIAQHEHNEALYQSISGSAFTDWAVTALFYSAIHLVEAALSAPPRPRGHVGRLREIAASPALAPVRRHYQELKQRSEDARYNCVPFTAGDVQAMYTRYYLPLRQHLRGLLGI